MSLSISKASLLIRTHCRNLSPSPSRLLYFPAFFADCLLRVGDAGQSLASCFTVSLFFPESWCDDEKNAALIRPNGRILLKMCAVEWKVWVWIWKMSWCSKASCLKNYWDIYLNSLPPECKDKENAALIGPNKRILPKMCFVEWKLWVWMWKMIWCSKTSCNSKTLLVHLPQLFFPESWREDKENAVLIGPNKWILPQMCSVE